MNLKKGKTRKSILAKIVALSMVLSTIAPAGMSVAFAASYDIAGHWAERTITSWQNKGLIGGYEDGSFKPDKAITRAEFVRLINQSLDFTDKGSVSFSDVASNAWYYNDVAIAMKQGYCSGFPDGTFKPNDAVTRAQAAAFVANAKGLTPNANAAANLTDNNSLQDWAKGPVGAVISSNYMSGYPDGSFQGNKVFTRAEAVSTLDRVMNGGVAVLPDINIDDDEYEKETTGEEIVSDKFEKGTSGGRGSGGGGGGGSSTEPTTETITKSVSDVTYNKPVIISKGSSDITLNNVTFNKGVTIKDAGVTRAASDSDIKNSTILFTGNTSIYGELTINTSVILNAVGRANFGKVVANYPTAFNGNTRISSLQANSTITTDKDTNVSAVTIAAKSNSASPVKVTLSGAVGTVQTSGSGTIGEINIGGNASPAIKLSAGVKTEKVTISDTATPKVEVEAGAEVDDVISTSSKPGAKVTGDGNVGSIVATDKDTIETPPEKPVETITLSRIAITSYPSKRDYVVGEAVNPTGMIVTGYYTLGGVTYEKRETQYSLTPSVFNAAGEITVVVDVKGKTDTFDVTVTGDYISKITLTAQPTKMVYKVDETLQLSGLTLIATYQSGNTQTINSYRDLAKYGLKATPANGAKLTLAENGKPIVISNDTVSANTGNLTVTAPVTAPTLTAAERTSNTAIKLTFSSNIEAVDKAKFTVAKKRRTNYNICSK